MKARAAFVLAARRGSVLIVVLWVCLGLVSITLLFSRTMLMAYRGSDNEGSGRQADQAIEGAARYAASVIADRETSAQWPDPATYVNEAGAIGEATFWFIGRLGESDSGQTRTFGLVDEASKLNLNSARLSMLQALPGMTHELAAAIVDWRDTDDELTENGAESETYLRHEPAYLCKNGPFESIEELALVYGADRTILYGEDANLNGVLDPNEDDGDKTLPSDNGDGKLDAGILEYVTVFTSEPNKRSDGSPRINVGARSPELDTLFVQAFGQNRAAAIFQQVGVARSRSVLEYFVRSKMTVEEFNKVSDALTATTAEFLTRVVNVNTASETVLACIPGIGIEKASELVATRSTRNGEKTDLTWVVPVLGDEGAIAAGRYITGRSFQTSADIAAVGRHGRGYRRTRFAIDHSTSVPRVVYRRDLAHLGWALGSDIRRSFTKERGER